MAAVCEKNHKTNSLKEKDNEQLFQNYSISPRRRFIRYQFSAFMVSKGFKVIAVNKEEGFENGNMPKIAQNKDRITIQAYLTGKPIVDGKTISVGNSTYTLL